jgi:hypothetical protein
MQTKPILIGFASAILILIVAAASFSAGLYLGQRGYVNSLQYQQQQTGPAGLQPGPNAQNPQGQFQPGGQVSPNQSGGFPNGPAPQGNSPQTGPGAGQPNQGADGPPGAPSWPPDLIGRVVSITATEIVLNTPNGDVTVPLSAETKYINEQGADISASDVQAGLVVGIFGRPTATVVMILPPPPNQQP